MRLPALLCVLALTACGSKSTPTVEPTRGKMVVTETTIEIYDRISFERDSAELQASSNDILDATASTLEGNPDITLVEVQGHCDPDEADVEALSQARAEAVMAYMVAKGIEGARLVAKGYGAEPWVLGEEGTPPEAREGVAFMILERESE